nr:PD-(D/E)XK nuclease family protein [bacterium]
VQNLRDELIRSGKLSRRDAELITVSQIAPCAAELAAKLPLHLRSPYQHFIELPVSLLVPAAEIAKFEGVDAASVGDELVHVQGAIDLLLDDGATVLLLDYKTGYTADAAALKAIHAPQLGWYCRAASLLLPGRRVLWALYGLDGAGLVGPFEYQAVPLH